MMYRFGRYGLNTATRQVVEGSHEIRLSPKAYELLLILVTNHDRAVSKTELQERLWPATFVEETNLATLVAEIRRALKDTAHAPTLIRTMYGFGYRFVAKVAQTDVPRRRGGDRVRPFLVVNGQHVILAEEENVIGRAEDAAVWIDSAGVSRRHARIVVGEGTATVEDLGSKNGTYVGAELVTSPRTLVDGDEIRVGPVSLTFRTDTIGRSTETVL